MKELRDIIQAHDKASSENKKTALATVVKVDGSSYRRPGARMLVTDDGLITGTISGGCLEGDALQKAQFAISTGENKLETYDSTDEDDTQFGLHLGCNGVVHILFEPIEKADIHNPVELFRRIADSGEDAVIVSFFSLKRVLPGTRLLFLKNELIGHIQFEMPAILTAQIQQSFFGKQSGFVEVEINNTLCTAFVEYVERPVSVVIAGAGNDVQPIVELASELGWSVTVADGRYTYAIPGRFPKAEKVLYSKPDDILSRIKTDSQTIFLLMTHNYNYDLAFLKQIIHRDFGYIGLLGPAQKRNRMLSDLRDAGIEPTEEQLSRMHGPMGLDIGAENATEIALSIVAEVKAFLSGRSGSPLKFKQESIHHRIVNVQHHA